MENMDTDETNLSSPTVASPAINAEHGVSILLAPSNLPNEIVSASPPSRSDAELEKLLNGSHATSGVVHGRSGRALLLVSSPGDSIPAYFGPLVETLSNAVSIESPDKIFSSTAEVMVDNFDAGHAAGSVVLSNGYSAGDLLQNLGSGGTVPGRNRARMMGGLVLVDAFVDSEVLGRIKWVFLGESTLRSFQVC